MSDVIETHEHRGFTIKICHDPDAESPREWSNLGTMACWHRRYNELGDTMPAGSPDDYLESLLDNDVLARLERKHERDQNRVVNLQGKEYFDAIRKADAEHHARVFAEVEKRYIILPVFMYDHSGLSLSTRPFSCPWDSGQVGYIHISLEKVREEYSVRAVTKKVREKATEALRQEVKVYSNWLGGGFTGYVVEDEDGETVDSCWGFDDQDYCLSQARDAADYEADRREEEAKEAALRIEQDQAAEALRIEAECRAEGCAHA